MRFVKPFSSNNAVKIVGFAINFSETVSDIEIVIENIKKDENFEKFYSSISEEITTIITPDNITQQRSSKAGIVLQSSDWVINLSKEMLIISCKKYTSWTEVSKQVFEYINIVLKYLKKDINQIALEYLDEFEILDIKSNWKDELFVKDSKYLNENIRDLDDFWHINQGRYLKLDEIDSKVLDSINVKFFANQRDGLKNKVNLMCQHRVVFQKHKEYDEKIENYFDILHTHTKEIFENIINKNIIENFN